MVKRRVQGRYELPSGSRVKPGAESAPTKSASCQSNVVRALFWVPRRHEGDLPIVRTSYKASFIVQVSAAVVTSVLQTHVENLLSCYFVNIRWSLVWKNVESRVDIFL